MEVGNAQHFNSGREIAAWIGLVPRQYSTGGKPKLLGISKRGNKKLRYLLVHGGGAVLSHLGKYKGRLFDWLRELRATKPFNMVCISLANKMTRVAWAVLRKGI